jgi:Ca2+-binding EF-hand superfamily protein
MAAFDTNGDDVITKKEVRKVLRKQFKQTRKEIMGEFKKADADKNGEVSREELKAAVRAYRQENQGESSEAEAE